MCDNEGKTPLHLAVHSNNLTIVEMLLKARANKLIKDNKNMSPEDDAYEKVSHECSYIITEYTDSSLYRSIQIV